MGVCQERSWYQMSELVTLTVHDFEVIVESPDQLKGVQDALKSESTSGLWVMEMLTLLMSNMTPEKRAEFLDLSVDSKILVLREWLKYA